MASGQWSVVLRHVQRLFHGGSVSGMTEGQLLERFVAGRDEVAFGALVARHGPMVLGVCRGVLDDPHDVEDAFQATFLVLVRKAAALRDRDLLGQWLYGVARRVALRARADAGRRKSREKTGIGPEEGGVASFDAELRELQCLVREEVDRLPANDRMAVVLCYLEGMTHEEAADRLGWPVGTVKGRLARARDRLRDRLTRRGVALPSAFAPALSRGASSVVPPHLIASTTLAASRLAAGQALTAGIASAHAVSLMEGVIGTMFMSKLKISAVALAATCAVAVPGVLAYQGQGFPVGGSAPKAGNPAPPGGVPAPNPGAGSITFGPVTVTVMDSVSKEREFQAMLAEGALKNLENMLSKGAVATLPADDYYRWSRRLVEARSGPGIAPADHKAALKGHRDRMAKLLKQANELAQRDQVSQPELREAQFRLSEADLWSLEDGPSQSGPQAGPPTAGGPGGGGAASAPKSLRAVEETEADQKRDKAILAKLEEPITMTFPNDTPFEDVKKYIESATQDQAAGFPNGIPIYVDPQALREVEKTMTSPININLEGIPLRTTLRLLLRQLGLTYRVEGGVLQVVKPTWQESAGAGKRGGSQ